MSIEEIMDYTNCEEGTPIPPRTNTNTIDQLHEEKREMQKQINNLAYEFQVKYGCKVELEEVLQEYDHHPNRWRVRVKIP